MLFSVSVVLGVALGAGLLLAARQDGSWPRWAALALGVLAALTFAAGILSLLPDAPLLTLPAISLPAAAVVFGVGRLVRRDRVWPVWVGTILGALPALFWIVFAIGEIVGPPH